MDDFFETFETLGAALAHGKPARKRYAQCDFGGYDDTDILLIPAHVIAAARRSAALGNCTLTVGDNCASDMAVMRIPDEEAEITDFKPHIEWGASNPIAPPREGRYKINRTIANKGIAPRLAEPAPPPATKTGSYVVGENDTPLAPIEKALVKGAQVIQLMRKAGGDADGLALLLGRVWGDEGLFDATEMVDLLGDVTLPRVLARGGKRRFEIYRNIGFTSLVSAGGSSADGSGYGSSSVINWQRRVELAKLFLHFAQSLEGGPLVEGSNFSITARIPAFTVPHVIWSDLAMDFCPQDYPLATSLGTYTTRAYEFLRNGISGALRSVSEFVRARGGITEGLDADDVVAGRYDQLTYTEPIARSLERRAVRSELAFATDTLTRNVLHGAYKAHDLRVAVFEVIAAQGLEKMDVIHTIGAMNALRKLDLSLALTDYRAFLLKVLADNPLILDAARIASMRPKNYEDRNRKAEWTRIANAQLPRVLLAGVDPYSAVVVALGTLHTLYRDHTSQVHRTVAYMNGESRELLAGGIRRKRLLMTARGADVETAIHTEIHTTNRAFYRERYRRPAKVWSAVSRYAADERTATRAKLEAAFWYARSDAAHLAQLVHDGTRVSIILSPKREKSIAAVYLSNCAVTANNPLLEDVKGAALWDRVAKHVADAHRDAGCENHAERIENHLESYLEVQQRDHAPLEEVVSNVLVTPVVPAPDLSELFSDIPNIETARTIDGMVSYWVSISGANQYTDAEEIEDLVEWMEEHLTDYVDDKRAYLATHSKDVKPKDAADLYDEWLGRKDDEDEEDQNRHRSEIS